jgi:phosphatidylethanolamine-binding protein (PEBP) family uncharacterized protein
MSRKVLVLSLLPAAAIPVIGLTSASEAAAPVRLSLTSTDVARGKSIAMVQVLNGFGCSGANLSPELKWTNAPAATKSSR